MSSRYSGGFLIFALSALLLAGCSGGEARFGVPENSSYSQSSPENTLRSVLRAIDSKDYAYLLAHLVQFPDNFSQGAFDMMLNAYNRGDEDQAINKVKQSVSGALASGEQTESRGQGGNEVAYKSNGSRRLKLKEFNGKWRINDR